MTEVLSQVGLAVFGLAAMWMALGNNLAHRRIAPLVGLCAQPFWLWFAWHAKAGDERAWGVLVISVAYTLVYIRGAVVQLGLDIVASIGAALVLVGLLLFWFYADGYRFNF